MQNSRQPYAAADAISLLVGDSRLTLLPASLSPTSCSIPPAFGSNDWPTRIALDLPMPNDDPDLDGPVRLSTLGVPIEFDF
jgi:hypothetical protein